MNELAQALKQTLISPNVADSNLEPASIVDAIAKLGDDISHGLKWLGNADAATPMGALEAHGKAIADGAETLASAITGAADEIASALRNVAEAIVESKQ